MTEFAKRLKSQMILKDITHEDLANAIGYDVRTLTRWIHDGRYPNRKAFVNMCKYLNVSSDYLLGLTEHPNKIKEI